MSSQAMKQTRIVRAAHQRSVQYLFRYTLVVALVASFIGLLLNHSLVRKSHVENQILRDTQIAPQSLLLNSSDAITWEEYEDEANWLTDHNTIDDYDHLASTLALKSDSESWGNIIPFFARLFNPLGSMPVVAQSGTPSATCNMNGVLTNNKCRCYDGWLTSTCSLRYDFQQTLGSVNLKWTYDATKIYVQLKAQTTGWVGIILNPSDGWMTNGDCWHVTVADSGAMAPTVYDRYSTGTNSPNLDTKTQDCVDVAGWQQSTGSVTTQVSFSRLLSTGDPQDFVFTSGMAPSTVSWAYGSSDTFSKHATSARGGPITVDWMQPKGTPSAPAAPALATATTTSVTVQWTASKYTGSGTLTNYTVQRETTPGSGAYMTVYTGMPALVSGSYKANITGLSPSSTYAVRVAASNNYYGLGPFSNPTGMTTLTAGQSPPSTPAAVVFVASSPTSLNVSWQAPSTNGAPITGYILQYAIGTGAYVSVPGTFSATTLQGSITGLPANTTFKVQVAATSVAGSSAWSPATIMSTPVYPTCLNGCSGRGTCFHSSCQCQFGYLGLDCSIRADFSWCGNNGGATFCHYWSYDSTYFYGQMKADTTGWIGMMIGADPSNGMMNADTWEGYVITDSSGSYVTTLNDMWSTSTVVPTQDSQQDLSDINGYETNGTTTVINFKRLLTTTDTTQDKPFVSGLMQFSWAYGTLDTPFSQHDSTARGKTTLEFLQPKGTPTAPAAPTLSSANTTTLTVQWTASAYPGSGGVITNYTIQRETTPGSGVYMNAYTGLPKTVATNPNTYRAQITGLTTGTYQVRVAGSNSYYGLGAFSTATAMTTLASGQSPPNAPALPVFISSSPTNITLSWTAPATNGAPITGYVVQYAVGAGSYTSFPSFSASTLQGTITGLNASTAYNIRVAASSVAGRSAFSNVTSMSTAAYAPCANGCSSRGTCFRSQCQCQAGYLGLDCSIFGDFSWCGNNGGNQWCTYWTYDSQYIYVQLQVQSTGWVGMMIGADPSNGMLNADTWMAYVTADGTGGQTVFAADMWSTTSATPATDKQQDLQDVLGYETNGTTTVWFKRLLVTTDTTQDDPVVSGDNYVSWAYGAADTPFNQHADNARGRVILQLLQPKGPPTAPTAPVMDTATTSSITLQWNDPDYYGSGGIIANYTVQRETAPGSGAYQSVFTGLPNSISTDPTVNTYSITVTGLTDTSTYGFRVAAANTIYGMGVFGNTSFLTTLSAAQQPPDAPAAPVFLSSTPTSVTVSWTAPATHGAPITGFQLQYSQGAGAFVTVPGTFSASTLQGSIPSLNAMTTYNIRVAALSVAGSSSFSASTSMTTAAYAACLNGCSGRGSCFRSQCQCQAGYLGLDCSIFADFNWCGNAGAKQWCTYWTYDSQYIYVQLQVQSTGWIGMMIGADPSNGMLNADTWMAYVMADGTGGQVVTAQDMWSTSTSTPGADQQNDLQDVLGYDTGSTTYVWFKRLLVTTDTIQDKPVVPGPMQVSWSYGPVDTPFNQHDSNARGRVLLEFLQPKGAPTAPEPPTLFTATTSSMTVQWTASEYPGSGGIISNYTVQRETAPGSGAYMNVYTGLPTAVSTSPLTYQASFSGLSASSTYKVRVAGSNTVFGLGTFSNYSSLTTLSASQLPPNRTLAPTFVSATPTSLTLSWTAPATNGAPITGYLLQYSTGGGAYVAVPGTFTASTLQATITGLTATTTYNVQVAATSVAGNSPWSLAGSMTTAAYAACPNNCNSNGRCVQAQCLCNSGFLGSDCSLPAAFKVCNDLGNMCLQWTYDSTQIYFQSESTTPSDVWYGWIVGHDASGGMNNGDAWTFTPLADISPSSVGTVLTLDDRFSGGNAIPPLDAQQDLVDQVSYVRAATSTTDQTTVVNFRRALDTGDSMDRPIVSGDMRVSWSVGTSLVLGEHLHTNATQGKILVNFLAPFLVGPPSPPLFQPPILTAASSTSVTFQFTASALSGSTPIVQYQAFLCTASSLAYFQSAQFSQLSSSAAYAAVQSNLVASLNFTADITSGSFSSLSAQTCYPLLVRALNSNGASNFSAVASVCSLSADAAPPAAPPTATINVIDGTGSGSTTPSTPIVSGDPTTISLGWPALHDVLLNSTTPLVGYTVEVQVISSDGTPLGNWTVVYTGFSPYVNITNLQPNTLYNVRLQATNVAGSSSYSQPLQVQTSGYALCRNNCNNQGFCVRGICQCNLGFLDTDCGIVGTTQELSSSPYFSITYSVKTSTTPSRRLLSNSSSNTGTVYVSLEAEAAANMWLGLIVNGDAIDGMSGGDAWMFSYVSNAVTAYDRYAATQNTPTQDSSQDLLNVIGFSSDVNRVRVSFSRLLDTGDAGDAVIQDEMMRLSWAMGAFQMQAGSPTFVQHDVSQRGKIKGLNFFAADGIELNPDIQISYFIPMPVAIAIFCVLAVAARNVDSVRQNGFVKVILHQPFFRSLNKYLNPFACFKVEIAATTGYRQHLLDVMTLDVRRTLIELSCGEAIFVALYAAAIAISAISARHSFDSGARAFWYFWGDLTALHLALAILPVARSSIFLLTCGVSFERAVKWHRWVARISLVCLVIHAIQMIQYFGFAKVVETPAKPTASGNGNIYGFIAGCCIVWMSCMAIEPFRRQAFRLFYYSHLLLSVPVYVLACMHSKTCFLLCIPAISLYVIDRAVRFWRSVHSTEIVGLEVIDIDIPDKLQDGQVSKPATCIIHIQLKQDGFKFEPGQYIFLNVPQISLIAWHPFSISSSNFTPGLFSVHILSRRTGLEGLREVAKQFQFGIGVGVRTGLGVVGIGNLPSSGNAKKEDSGQVVPVEQRVVSSNELTKNPAVIAASDDSDPERGSVHADMSWEQIPLNPFSWTSDLLIRSMRYFARCSSFVSSGNQYRNADDFPPVPFSVRVDGPYGNINMAMKRDYHTLVLVAGGIGITPFFSILYDLLRTLSGGAVRDNCPIEVVHLVWVCSDANVFHIIHPALWQRIKLSPRFRLHFFATRNARKELNASKPVNEQFDVAEGRPDWRNLFHKFAFSSKAQLEFDRKKAEGSLYMGGPDVEMQTIDPNTKINTLPQSDATFASEAAEAAAYQPQADTAHLGVAAFACGPAPLVADVEEQCAFHKIEFHKEVFAL